MIRSIYIVLLLLFFVSCGSSEEDVPPISNEKFAKILIDAQLVESHARITRPQQPFIKDSIGNYYAEVFSKHGITEKEFSEYLSWYSAHPSEMDQSLQIALAELKSMEKELQDVVIVSEPINSISCAVVSDIIIKTPFYNTVVNDSLGHLQYYRDSLFFYLRDNDSILTESNTNFSSFVFSFNRETSRPKQFSILKATISEKLNNPDE